MIMEDDMAKTTSDGDAAAAQTHAGVERMAERSTDAIESVKASMHSAVDNVTDKAAAATQWASDTVNKAKQTPTDLVEAGAEYIRARPYVAVGAALAVGYVIGKLR